METVVDGGDRSASSFVKEENVLSTIDVPLIPMVECRICQDEDHIKNPESPCSCRGSLKYSITKAICIAFVMSFFSVFDVPVFWPILLCYWIVLFFLTMKRQIMHMIKYKYIPFNTGKQKYTGKKASTSSNLARD